MEIIPIVVLGADDDEAAAVAMSVCLLDSDTFYKVRY